MTDHQADLFGRARGFDFFSRPSPQVYERQMDVVGESWLLVALSGDDPLVADLTLCSRRFVWICLSIVDAIVSGPPPLLARPRVLGPR